MGQQIYRALDKSPAHVQVENGDYQMPLSGDLSFYIDPPGYDDPTVLVSSVMSYTTNRCIRVYMILCTRSRYWGWRGGGLPLLSGQNHSTKCSTTDVLIHANGVIYWPVNIAKSL